MNLMDRIPLPSSGSSIIGVRCVTSPLRKQKEEGLKEKKKGGR